MDDYVNYVYKHYLCLPYKQYLYCVFDLFSTVYLTSFSMNIAGRLKVNMGNIYFRQRNYPKAIKFYRMALDQVPNSHKEMRQE